MPRPDAPLCSMCGQSSTRASIHEASGQEDTVGKLLFALSAEFERLKRENRKLAWEFEQFHMRPGGPPLPVQDSSKCNHVWSDGSEPVGHSNMPDSESQNLLQAKFQVRDHLEEYKGEKEEEEDEELAAEVLAYARKHSPRSLNSQQTHGDVENGSATSRSEPHGTEDHYERLYDLTRAFHQLCAPHKATISDQELVHLKSEQVGIDALAASAEALRPRYTAAIRALNRALGIMVSTSSTPQPAKEINLDTFIAIMQQKELKSTKFLAEADSEVLEAVSEIRDVLVREDAMRKIAKATNMPHMHIYQSSRRILRPSRLHRLVRYLDPVIGVVIIFNAIVIGVSTDYMQDSNVWKVCEITFTSIFIMEICIKLCTQGFIRFCCGTDRYWNLFDATVVVIAVFDVVFGALVDLSNFTVVRLLRFARLTKLVRVLKLKAFKELALLVNGIFAGVRTLIWAIVFLAFLLFSLGVLLTQTVGQMEEEHWDSTCESVEGTAYEAACVRGADHLRNHRKELFGDVSRSMFTVFRCFTDGCSSVDGTPLVPYVYSTHGLLAVMLYMMVMLFVIFGLFNLIMAVFVENTIENAKYDDGRRREAREMEALRVAKKLQDIIILFCTGGAGDLDEDTESPCVPRGKGRLWSMWNLFSTNSAGGPPGHETDSHHVSNLSIQVTHSAFYKMLQKPEVHEMLDDLDVGVNSRGTLFEVLDANGNGTLEVSELVQGLLKLRGTADKGDLVAALLAIRSIQKGIKAIELLSLHQQEVIDDMKHAQASMHLSLQELQGPKLKSKGSSVGLEILEGQTERPSCLPGMSQMRADVERRVARISSLTERRPSGGAPTSPVARP